MEFNEILGKLKEAANFSMEKTSAGWTGHGSINSFPKWEIPKTAAELTRLKWEYRDHYLKSKEILESLPWKAVVDNPRCPKNDEYPDRDGEYITMLDCDEHAVWCNTFKDGSWVIYNRTHVKWWMPVPENFEIK